jgi:hypothetical protein
MRWVCAWDLCHNVLHGCAVSENLPSARDRCRKVYIPTCARSLCRSRVSLLCVAHLAPLAPLVRLGQFVVCALQELMTAFQGLCLVGLQQMQYGGSNADQCQSNRDGIHCGVTEAVGNVGSLCLQSSHVETNKLNFPLRTPEQENVWFLEKSTNAYVPQHVRGGH